jgi:hypothetical protein
MLRSDYEARRIIDEDIGDRLLVDGTCLSGGLRKRICGSSISHPNPFWGGSSDRTIAAAPIGDEVIIVAAMSFLLFID